MATGLIIALSVTGGVVGLLLVLRAVMRTVRRKLQGRIEAKFNREEILAATDRANFFGEKSKGGAQVRGNGALVLTKDLLYFLRAVPEKEYVIPISAIRQITLPKAFNGKSVLAPLLCVQYARDAGTDAMAWAVKDPGHWKAAIERLVNEAGRSSVS